MNIIANLTLIFPKIKILYIHVLVVYYLLVLLPLSSLPPLPPLSQKLSLS